MVKTILVRMLRVIQKNSRSIRVGQQYTEDKTNHQQMKHISMQFLLLLIPFSLACAQDEVTDTVSCANRSEIRRRMFSDVDTISSAINDGSNNFDDTESETVGTATLVLSHPLCIKELYTIQGKRVRCIERGKIYIYRRRKIIIK